MSRYAAFLRGMNVGGHRLTNDELCSCFLELGFREVASFRASGNVVFNAGAQTPAALTARIEDGLAAALGYAVPTFVRAAEEVRAIAAMQPFPQELVRASEGKLQVAMLSSPPSSHARDALLALESDLDRLAFGERELYWLPSGRMLESALDMNTIEKLLGSMTMRTKSTIEHIASRYLPE